MEVVIRATVYDPLTIDALERAKKNRKMAKLVSSALSYYVRTEEGKREMEALAELSEKPKRNPVTKPTASTRTIQKKTVNIDDLLAMK